MASFILPSPQSHFLQKCKSSSFLGETTLLKPSPRLQKVLPSTFSLNPMSKFDLFQIMGGRGLCNGEEGLLKELDKTITPATETSSNISNEETSSSNDLKIPENAFNKELLGLTGGFPGGEKGLQTFLEKNPPPKKAKSNSNQELDIKALSNAKPKAPELPLLMPGMTVLVKNERNPFYMYCGIIQRITDGQAGVLFEGGNWDKLLTFRLDELERRDKGPPMVNPKSVIVEFLAQKDP